MAKDIPGTPADQQRAVFTLLGMAIAVAGVAASLFEGAHSTRSIVEVLVLAVFTVAAGLWLSFVMANRTGTLVVINPAVCFSFAIMLTWGLLPALCAHLAAVCALTWRRRLSAGRGVLLVVQFATAFIAAYGILRLAGSPGPTGNEWTAVHDAKIVVVAAATWLFTYLVFGYVVARADSHRERIPTSRAAGTALLYNAALVVLSPAVAVTAEINVFLAALVLVPLYATQRMARLSVERERANRLDPLTSLANRNTLREEFDRFVAAGKKQPSRGRPVLVLLGLDRFKYVNDSLGYEVGDQLLVTVASRLTKIHSGHGTVARLGADEFAILGEASSPAAADDLAARTVEAFREPVWLEGLLVDVTASVGVATRDGTDDDFSTVLRHADAAMYDAKRRGDGISAYQDEVGNDSPERLGLLADFRQALLADDNDEIVMHYQPQLNLATGEIDGLEALLRWTHPREGPIDAMTVLGLAEHTTVMHLLTANVIDNVTEQLARWRRDGLTPRVAINISARDLYGENIVAQLGERLAHYQLPPHQFQVEVTESALMADPTRARDILRRIADLGIDISFDDFGTGYSSLQNVRGMPLSEIKVDQTFVQGMTRNQTDAAIVASTINLAHSLGLRAVAEGVEDEATQLLLQKLGCDLGQGWHISHAVPTDRIPTLIADRRDNERHA